MRKIIKNVFIVFVMFILLIPVIFINGKENIVSETENRYLSNWPTANLGTEEWKNQFESWLEDRIAFRDKFLNIRSWILYKGFNVVSSDKVISGKEGWLFYTLENNIEISRGEFPLNEEILKEIAEVQQGISDYYKSLGKTYAIVLTPSKVSIYPEKLYGNYSITRTPSEIVYDYLTEHTDVIVINPKDYLISAKDEGQTHWKTDTHWTSFGSYQGYKAIIDTLNSVGIIDCEVIDVKRITESRDTDLISMLGLKGVIQENSDAIRFESTSMQVTSGHYYESILNICNNSKVLECVMYENSQIDNDLKVLIYGNSQFKKEFQMLQLLSENFSNVIYCHQSPFLKPSYDVDSIVDPDIVLLGVGERFLNQILNHWPQDIPAILPKLSVEENDDATSRIHIDMCNGINIMNNTELLSETIEKKCLDAH